MDKYEKLTEDIKKALAAGAAAEAARPGDGGTCNFDSPALRLPRWIGKKIQAAAEAAGTFADDWDLYGHKYWIIWPNCKGHADARCVYSRAMCKAFDDLGYDCTEYCQAD